MKFADWLNCVDARIGYDRRRKMAPVEGWLSLHEDCFSVKGAIRFYAEQRSAERNADHVDGYDRDDLGESPDF